jgi:hypothetical protein
MTDVQQEKTIDQRDQELHSAFVRAYVEDVSILEDIPNGSALILVPDDDPELAETNLGRAVEAARRGYDVYIRHFPRTKPSPGALDNVQGEHRKLHEAHSGT